jgi:hypothetical protein
LLEKIFKLVSKSGQVSIVRVLNISCSHNGFKELSLKHNASWAVYILRLDSQLGANVGFFLLAFVLLFKIRVFTLLRQEFSEMVASILAVKPVHQVELCHLLGAQEREVVLLSLVVDSIEVSESGIVAGYLAVTEKTPNLTKGHAETFLGFGSFNLASVKAVPRLEV